MSASGHYTVIKSQYKQKIGGGMDIENILSGLADRYPGLEIKTGEPMSKHTSFQIGGPAKIWCEPVSAGELSGVIRFANEHEIPSYVVGSGSNLLVSDRGIDGMVIWTGRLDGLRLENDTDIIAQCGVSLARLARFARVNSLSGLEFAQGIPGTVGGGVYMNAGAYDGEIKDAAVFTEYLDSGGKLERLDGEEQRFGYRSSYFSGRGDLAIVQTCFRLERGSEEAIAGKMAVFREKRQKTQPLNFPSAGSAFKRPPGGFAGQLISDSGLRGYTVGGAQVSEKHAGFIINAGGATCEDVICLINHVKQTVLERSGIALEPEIRIIGAE
jgi:UDP-N-acetylmuramate dehydrogenase